MKKNLDKNDNMFHIDNKKLAAAFDFSTIGIRLFLTIIFILAVSVVHASNAFCETLETESYLVISDIHLTREAQDQATMLEAIIQVAKGKDVVLFLGDNSEPLLLLLLSDLELFSLKLDLFEQCFSLFNKSSFNNFSSN